MKKSLLKIPSGRIWMLPFAAVMLLATGACGDFFTTGIEEKEEPADKYDFIRRLEERKFIEQAADSGSKDGMIVPDESFDGDELREIAEKLSRDGGKKPDPERRRRSTPFYEDFILIDGDETVEVMLVFNSVPLIDTLPAFADALGFNFTADADLKSVVTLNINSTMTRRELWEAFDEMLKAAAAGVIRNGQMLKFMPAEKMPAQYGTRGRNRFGAANEVISYALVNAGAKDTAAQLKPFLTKEGTIVELPRQNMILITDHAGNIPKLKQILDAVDQPGRAQWPRMVIYCSNVKPSRIGQELSEVLPVIGLPVVLLDANSSAEDPGAVRLTAIDRLQLLVATAATDETLKEIREWARILDNADSTEQERAYVYKVAHGKAKELAQALAVIFTTQGASLTVDTTSDSDTSRSTTERSETLNTAAGRTQTAATTNSSIANRNSTNNLVNTKIDRVSGVFENTVRVFADGVSNRLVIRTTPRTYATIKALLDKLDIMPAQVLLQVLIVEITLSNNNEFGVEFNTVGTTDNVGTSVGTHYKDIGKGDENAEGFKFGIFNPNNPEEKFGFLRALAGREKVKVISSPQIVVNSNTEALVKVGRRVPVLQSDLGSVEGASTNVMRTYNYENTGVNLTITPQITSTNLISLDLIQEVSEAVTNTITTATDTPVINQRILQTSMTVANGKTMVIGGIIQESLKDQLKSMPIIADIPVLNRLLGNTAMGTERTEMLVMITCYIIDEKSRVEDMVRRYNESVKTLSQFEMTIEKMEISDLERARAVHGLDTGDATENKN